MDNELLRNLEEMQFETLIQGLFNEGFGVCDDFVEPSLESGLRQNLQRYREAGKMHPAGVGRKFDFSKNTLVRGDVIKWIEEDSSNVYEQTFLQKVERFISYLNQTCYTGLNDHEFHYANYAQASFYKRHLDQFKSNKGRKFSMVLYLNQDWKVEDGGYLTLYLDRDKNHNIYPLGGRLVFFRSDEMEHEVHPSFNRDRISIAGWLKSV